jgi:CBS domain-containing protein/ElaB/YqjD/DUF883 family membrane-anchored ribosome-binding protein
MDAHSRRVSEIMQTEVVTLSADENLDLAQDVMHLGRVRHMPVLEGTRLVGLVSSRDLLSASLTRSLEFDEPSRRAFIRSIQVKEVMTRDVVTVSPDTSLGEAARRMLRDQIGCVPVVGSDATLIGLVTESDLLRAALIEVPRALDSAREIVGDEPVEEKRMTDLGDKLNDEFESLKRTRDELRVQMQLAKAEAKDLWARMEEKLQEVESRVKLTSREAEAPAREAKEAIRSLLHEIGEGYRRIRKVL